MDEICRLCCSTNFVNNDIFDEENALYLKMSLYLPIKVFKNDRLPQKICDKCSCRVNDFYQFCNETIEVQNRLRAAFISTAVEIEESIDLTLIKNDLSPLPHMPGTSLEPNVVHKVEPNLDPDGEPSHSSYGPSHPVPSSYGLLNKGPISYGPSNEGPSYGPSNERPSYGPSNEVPNSYGLSTDRPATCGPSTNMPANPPPTQNSEQPCLPPKPIVCDQSTQTEKETHEEGAPNEINIDVPLYKTVKVKEEPKHSPTVKMEDFFLPDNGFEFQNSDDSENDNISLINFQKKKKNKCKKAVNGKVQKKKRKSKASEWEVLMRALPEGTVLVDPAAADVKPDIWPDQLGFDSKKVKSEPVEFHCCICFVQCYSRSEMLQHYKEHGTAAAPLRKPAPPPPPDTEPIKCPRCQKRLERSTWAAHWSRHWERDHLPYRCALCEKAFRDRHQILKHGLTHKLGEGTEVEEESASKRYVCDLCPAGFVYMRYLLAHRTTAHPEAAGRALALRCAVCAREFAHLNSLRRHLTAHTGARDFLCNICGKALSSREHLKFHIRIHTGFKPNVCKTCGKGFVKKCNLTLHERVHSGEKPHVCSHCGKAFSQRSTLVIHERYHSGARPYICSLCGRGFVAKGLLSMHLKTTCI